MPGPTSGGYPAAPSSGGYAPVPTSGAHAPLPTSGYAPSATPWVATPAPDPVGACNALVGDPRYGGFARTLMIRPGGRWYDVIEVCRTGMVATPPTLPIDQQLYVTWVEHPHPDPSLAAVVFLSLRTGWSTVILCPRARW